MRLDSSGRLGLGTSSPGSFNSAANQLVLGSGSGSQGLTVFSGNGVGDQGSIFFADGTTGGAQQAAGYIYYAHNTDSMVFGTANSPRITVTSAGNVGIGTTSPVELLSLSGSSANGVATGIGVLNTESGALFNVAALGTGFTQSGWPSITDGIVLRSGGNASGGLAVQAASGPIAFWSVDSERARIDSSGRLLVGTSSDSGGALLQVNGNRVRVATAKTPASASDTGTTGEICWDANYVYVCTATNTWKRSAISTW
jgi:hypothetical protein